MAKLVFANNVTCQLMFHNVKKKRATYMAERCVNGTRRKVRIPMNLVHDEVKTNEGTWLTIPAAFAEYAMLVE